MGNITPLDIRKQTFRTVFRGADNEEVRVFLDLVASEQERLIELVGQLTERVRHCEDRLAEYREIDQTLRSSVLSAERHAEAAREASKREAGLVMQEAEWRAKQMLEDARERLNRLSDEIRDLQAKKDSFVQHMRGFLQAQMELLEHNESYLHGVDRLADDAASLYSKARRAEARPAAAPPPRNAPAAQRPAETSYEPEPEDYDFPSPMERPTERSMEGSIERPMERPAERPTERPIERPTERPTDRSSAERPSLERLGSGRPAADRSAAPPPSQMPIAHGPSQAPQQAPRGLGRFNRNPGPSGPPPPSPRSAGDPYPSSRQTPEGYPASRPGPEGYPPSRPSPERSEGLFEISAEDEDQPRP